MGDPHGFHPLPQRLGDPLHQILRRAELALDDRTADEHERWVGERKGVKVVCNIHSWPADKKTRLEKVRSRLTITQGKEKKTQETTWNFRTYNARQMKALLKKGPRFELVACYDFTHLIENERKLDDSYSDVVMVLRRK